MARIHISNKLGRVKQGVPSFKEGRVRGNELRWKGNEQIKVKFVKTGLKKQGL